MIRPGSTSAQRVLRRPSCTFHKYEGINPPLKNMGMTIKRMKNFRMGRYAFDVAYAPKIVANRPSAVPSTVRITVSR